MRNVCAHCRCCYCSFHLELSCYKLDYFLELGSIQYLRSIVYYTTMSYPLEWAEISVEFKTRLKWFQSSQVMIKLKFLWHLWWVQKPQFCLAWKIQTQMKQHTSFISKLERGLASDACFCYLWLPLASADQHSVCAIWKQMASWKQKLPLCLLITKNEEIETQGIFKGHISS